MSMPGGIPFEPQFTPKGDMIPLEYAFYTPKGDPIDPAFAFTTPKGDPVPPDQWFATPKGDAIPLDWAFTTPKGDAIPISRVGTFQQTHSPEAYLQAQLGRTSSYEVEIPTSLRTYVAPEIPRSPERTTPLPEKDTPKAKSAPSGGNSCSKQAARRHETDTAGLDLDYLSEHFGFDARKFLEEPTPNFNRQLKAMAKKVVQYFVG